MITLHRLGHPTAELFVNDELIVSVEATPDTVITLSGGDKVVVAESPEAVCAKVRECRIEILSGAILRRDAKAGGRIALRIEIDQQHGQFASIAQAIVEACVEQAHQLAAIEHAGQRVGDGGVIELLGLAL